MNLTFKNIEYVFASKLKKTKKNKFIRTKLFCLSIETNYEVCLLLHNGDNKVCCTQVRPVNHSVMSQYPSISNQSGYRE